MIPAGSVEFAETSFQTIVPAPEVNVIFAMLQLVRICSAPPLVILIALPEVDEETAVALIVFVPPTGQFNVPVAENPTFNDP